MSNKRSRKYLLTINNPFDYGFTHEEINKRMNKVKWIYYCFGEEEGQETHTHHIHLFFVCKNAMYFDTVRKLFDEKAHIDIAYGTAQENIDYILKQGKHSNKADTIVPDTFEEYGDRPVDTTIKNETVSADVLNMIVNGCSNAEIIEAHPSYLSKITHLDSCRNELLNEQYKNAWRNVDVEYIYGKTGTGKTRSVMDKYGYENVCKITNYPKERPFSNYKGQDVLCLDEFYGGIPLNDLLQYTDGYPCDLPSRYNDKTACYTKVVIISNIPLEMQYKNIQEEKPLQWNAFIRRINRVTEFVSDDDLYIGVEPKITKISHNPQDYML